MKDDIDQEIAAKYIKNHSLIIAGAGSGKTTTLIKKVNYLINNKVTEKEILVISFTNETVNNFKKKCEYNIDVFTFHKLAKNILNTNQDIIEDDILKDIIFNILYNINKKLKKKIFHIFYLNFFSPNKYIKSLKNSSSSSLISYFYSLIKQIKTNQINIYNLKSKNINRNEAIILYVANLILDKYNKVLTDNNFIDFDDLIINATDYLNNGLYKSNYKHILVDEYQDISLIRLNFLKSLIKSNNSVLTAVGDDFQAIYGYSGSSIKYFYNFKNYFQNAKTFYIKTSYRCPKYIINKAGKFIMKNKMQIKKNLKTTNNSNSKINKIYTNNIKKDLLKLVNLYVNKNKSVLILGRNNFDINFIVDKNVKIVDSYIEINSFKTNIRYLTIHKSKGLEADIVIIINLTNTKTGIPSKDSNILIDKITENNEKYKYAEERRLFYVALTRTKDKLYLLIDKNNPSIFIKEI